MFLLTLLSVLSRLLLVKPASMQSSDVSLAAKVRVYHSFTCVVYVKCLYDCDDQVAHIIFIIII